MLSNLNGFFCHCLSIQWGCENVCINFILELNLKEENNNIWEFLGYWSSDGQ